MYPRRALLPQPPVSSLQPEQVRRAGASVSYFFLAGLLRLAERLALV